MEFKNGGTLYFIWPRIGQQKRYSFDPRITDSAGLHWHFIHHAHVELINDKRVRTIVSRHPFRLNPFFYHCEWTNYSCDNKTPRSRSFYGASIIKRRYQCSLKAWLETNYPEYVMTMLNDENRTYNGGYDEVSVPIFDHEWSKAVNAIHKAADAIWNELRDLDDVNPLN